MIEDSRHVSADARRALVHISIRTAQGRFATGLYDMPGERWEAAIRELRAAGQDIRWTSGRVADDPGATGGWVVGRVERWMSQERSRGDVLSEPGKRTDGKARTWEELAETDRRWISEHGFEDAVIEGRARVPDDEGMGLEL